MHTNTHTSTINQCKKEERKEGKKEGKKTEKKRVFVSVCFLSRPFVFKQFWPGSHPWKYPECAHTTVHNDPCSFYEHGYFIKPNWRLRKGGDKHDGRRSSQTFLPHPTLEKAESRL